MILDSKLYSVWIDDNPSTVLSSYVNDGAALTAFRELILSIRDDMAKGLLSDGTDASMSLYVHGYLDPNGCVRGLLKPIKLMDGIDVHPESVGECEVVEE